MFNDSDNVAKLWGERAANKATAVECHWTDSDLITRYYIHPSISGKMEDNWFTWIKNTYFVHPVDRALSLGCGDGGLERHGALVDVFRHCDAFDLSPGAIQLAREKAIEVGVSERISYESRDINTISLKEDFYDAVFCSMALHHFENLEHVLDEILKALKPDGLFIINEFVGPNRFQWTYLQLGLSNVLLRLLPRTHRYDPTTKSVKDRISRPSLQYMISTDPSEAVRSVEILPLLGRRFHILKRIDYGGTIVNLLLDNIIVNFDERKKADLAKLKLIFTFEKLLIKHHLLDSDFVVVVARKLGGPHPVATSEG